MKKILIILCAVFICGVAIAQTIRWHIGDTVYQTTTCNAGESITPPTAPEKFGYSFVRYDAYTPIEYLESTGTQWIDTGYVPNISTKIEIVGRQGGGDCEMFGISDTLFVFNNNINSSGSLFYSFFAPWDGPLTPNLSDGVHIVSMSKHGGLIIDNIKIVDLENTTSTSTKYRISLFGRIDNASGTIQKLGSHKIYSFKIYDNDILVRDFVPVLDGNGTPCMYDNVEHKFYYNAGTGQFIAGPVVGE